MLCSPNHPQTCGSLDQRHVGYSYRSASSLAADMTNASSRSHVQGATMSNGSETNTINASPPSSLPTRPRNHIRSISIEPTSYSGFTAESRARDRAGFLSPQEKQQMELEREAVLQIQNAQAAKRRHKFMRLTPAFPHSKNKSPSPPLSAPAIPENASSGSTNAISTEENKVPFPSSASSPVTAVATMSSAPLHPASRKALALKANSPGPEVSGLHLDLACIPAPSSNGNGCAFTTSIPEMIRKKSGEPVKSSLKQHPSSAFYSPRSASDASLPSTTSLRGAKSVPSTPSMPKAVHFDTNLEHIKIFKVKGKPQAVSREGSPEQTETETEEEREFPYFGSRRYQAGRAAASASGAKTPSPIATPPSHEPEEQLVLRLPNFPSSAKLSVDRDIFLERVYLSDDLRSVKGTVQVRNLSFEKWVAVRFTLDHWATVNEVSAEYAESIKGGTADRFVFSIKLNELLNWPRGAGAHETKTMFLCLRYTVGGREIWDNNDDANYQLDFRKRQVPSSSAAGAVPPTAEVDGSASNSGTMPRRYTTGGMAPNSTSRSADVGKRPSILASKYTKNDFMVERLRRELDRLRSDDEEMDGESSVSPALRRRSPPVSPGGAGRASSPSTWTSRYDFGASLRDPRSGSRKTDAGRAAALDYFSSKPTMSSPIRSHFVISTASPQGSDGSTPRVTPEPSPKFQQKFGMLSPGLGYEMVEHAAMRSHTPSPKLNTLTVPHEDSHAAISMGSARFNSFPPRRNSGSPKGLEWGEAAASQHDVFGNVPGSGPSRLTIKPDGLVLEDYTPDGSQASPVSATGSPNPFSPTMSVSSIESDTTISMTAQEAESSKGAGTSALAAANGNRMLSGSVEDLVSSSQHPSFLRDDTFVHRPRPSSYAAGDSAEHHGYSNSTSPSVQSSSQSPSSELPTPDDLLRPTNLTSFNELVARFCWNSDTHVSVQDGQLSQLDATPPATSGRSTPTARASAF